MNKSITRFLGISILFLFAVTPVASQQKTITIIGSNTVFPIMEVQGSRFQELSGISIDIQGPGSGAGIAALINGETEIAPMSRAPKDGERADAVAVGIALIEKTIALDALVIITNNANPINGLTSEQIGSIYSGNITSWKDLGWTDGGDITVIERDENSGTHDYFNDFFLDGNEVDPNKVVTHSQQSSTSLLFELVADDTNAIGYGGLAFLDDTVKAVSVDGVEANKANAKNSSYAVARPLFLVYDDNTISKEAKTFVDYSLSPEGQFLVEDVGYVAVEPIGALGDATGFDLGTSEDNAPISFSVFLVTLGIIILATKKRKN